MTLHFCTFSLSSQVSDQFCSLFRLVCSTAWSFYVASAPAPILCFAWLCFKCRNRYDRNPKWPNRYCHCHAIFNVERLKNGNIRMCFFSRSGYRPHINPPPSLGNLLLDISSLCSISFRCRFVCFFVNFSVRVRFRVSYRVGVRV